MLASSNLLFPVLTQIIQLFLCERKASRTKPDNWSCAFKKRLMKQQIRLEDFAVSLLPSLVMVDSSYLQIPALIPKQMDERANETGGFCCYCHKWCLIPAISWFQFWIRFPREYPVWFRFLLIHSLDSRAFSILWMAECGDYQVLWGTITAINIEVWDAQYTQQNKYVS